MSIAYAHPGEVHIGLSWVDLLTHITLDPVLIPPMVLLVWLYLRGLRLRGERRMVLPGWRVACFAAGMLSLMVGLLSGLDILADTSFTGHMIQHMLIMQVGVPLLLLGAPFLPVVRGLPQALRWKAFVPLANNPLLRVPLLTLFRPVPAFAIFTLVVAVWHLPTFHNAAIYDEALHYLQHFSFLLGSMFFWWNIVSPYPFQSRLNPFMRIAWLFLISIVNSAVSAMIVWSGMVLYDYGNTEMFLGLSPQHDQSLGGALMWVMGGMMYLGAISVVFATYAAQEAAKEPAPSAPQQPQGA